MKCLNGKVESFIACNFPGSRILLLGSDKLKEQLELHRFNNKSQSIVFKIIKVTLRNNRMQRIIKPFLESIWKFTYYSVKIFSTWLHSR